MIFEVGGFAKGSELNVWQWRHRLSVSVWKVANRFPRKLEGVLRIKGFH